MSMYCYKYIVSSLLIVFIFASLAFSASCSSSRYTNATNGDERLLLEVVSESEGPVYPPGKTLTLRLYSDAAIEFDFFPQYGPDLAGVPFRTELKRSAITGEQFDAFLTIFDKMRFDEPKTMYTPTRRILDSKIRVTVNYLSDNAMKKIIIEENDSHVHLESSGVYPDSLVQLLKLVDAVYWEKRKALLEETKKNVQK
ncbi:MAG: hypothetical protein ABI999_09495 [Acidobacteriota bacterium]